MRDRIQFYGLLLLFTVLSVEPMFRKPPRDGFPFSNYPMFSERKNPLVWINQAIAITEEGKVPLSPSFIANEEVMQAASTLRRTFDRGREASDALCRQVASRVAEANEDGLKSASRVELVSAQLNAVEYFSGGTEPKQTRVHARCEVLR